MNSLWFILLSLLLAIFFAGIEIAFASSNKMKIELAIKQRGIISHILLLFLRNSALFSSVIIIGYYISVITFSVSFVWVIHPIVYSFFQTPFWFIIIELSIVALLIIATVEFFAQTLFRIEPYWTLYVLSIPAFFFFLFLSPIAWIFINCSKAIVKLIAPVKNLTVLPLFEKFNLTEWYNDINSKQEEVNKNDQELKIFQNALVFSKVRIRDCMIPRTEIEAININAGIEDLRKKFISSGYSKIIVYRNSIDNIVGYVNSKELFKHPVSIKEKLNHISFVPETMPASKLLHDFMQYHRSVAVVVDEYGGTSGLVTLEDIMEEIFGEIEDEHDTDDLVEKEVNKNEFIFSSRLEIEYLNSKYGFKIPESEEYDTLAGFILFHHHNLPKPNAVIEIGEYNFKILRVSNTRIELVFLEIKEK